MSIADAAPRVPPDKRRPAFAFRIGVTGAASLPDREDLAFAAICVDLDEVLARIHAQLDELVDHPRVRASHDYTIPPTLRCLSPLGEGADRLFAETVLALRDGPRERHSAEREELRVSLEIVIPFACEDYKATFSQGKDAECAAISRAIFDELLARADAGPTELDGAIMPDEVRHQSYADVGRLVVRNADLMIAIWDQDKAAKGIGGTRDTVHFALRAGVPVWVIDPSCKHRPRLFTDSLDLWGDGPLPERADARLEKHIADILIPPALANGADELIEYFEEPLEACHNVWLFHPAAMRRLRGAPAPQKVELREGATRKRYHGAFNYDRAVPAVLSEAYKNRYRSSYLMIFIAAAIALVSAVVGLVFHRFEAIATGCEILALGSAGWLVLKNHRGRWHERYVSYRLLSELNRSTKQLRRLGWSLPFGNMRRAAGHESQAWIGWLVAAHYRSTALYEGAIGDGLDAVRDEIVDKLLKSQIDFHARRSAECERGARRLRQAGTSAFLVAVALALIKVPLLIALALAPGEAAPLTPSATGAARHLMDTEFFLTALTFLAAVIPAFSAAAFGIRAYEDFEQLQDFSDNMRAGLAAAQKRMKRIVMTRPLSSQALASELFEAASLMLTEASGWAQMIRIREVEAG